MEKIKVTKLSWIIIVTLLLSVCVHVIDAASTKPASVLLQEGLYAEEVEGNLDEAINIYQQVVESSQQMEQAAAQAIYRMGLCYLKKGDQAQAAQKFNQLISKFPEQHSLVQEAQKQLEKFNPPATYIFSQVVNLEIPCSYNDKGKTTLAENSFFDFETAKLFSMPAKFDLEEDEKEEIEDWLRQNKIDGGGIMSDDNVGRLGSFSDKGNFANISNNAWSIHDPEAIVDMYHHALVEPMTNYEELPASYLFETSEGNYGILQILNVTDKTINIRYKQALREREVFVPDWDTKDVGVVLDLATGNLLTINELREREYDKGDFGYDDNYLICVRNAKAYLLDSNAQDKRIVKTMETLEESPEDMTAYKLDTKNIPGRYQVTTAEGDNYELNILSANSNGLNIRYTKIPTPKPNTSSYDPGIIQPELRATLEQLEVFKPLLIDLQIALEQNDAEKIAQVHSITEDKWEEFRRLVEGTSADVSVEYCLATLEQASKDNESIRKYQNGLNNLEKSLEKLASYPMSLGYMPNIPKAINICEKLESIYGGVYKAVEDNNYDYALVLTNGILELEEELKSSVLGSQAEILVKDFYDLLGLLRDALGKGDVQQVYAQFEIMSPMGPEIVKVLTILRNQSKYGIITKSQQSRPDISQAKEYTLELISTDNETLYKLEESKPSGIKNLKWNTIKSKKNAKYDNLMVEFLFSADENTAREYIDLLKNFKGITLLQVTESDKSNPFEKLSIETIMDYDLPPYKAVMMTDDIVAFLEFDRNGKDRPTGKISYEITWDNKTNTFSKNNPESPVKMLPLLGAQNWEEAITNARNILPELRKSTHMFETLGMPDQKYYIAVITTDNNLAVVMVDRTKPGDNNYNEMHWWLEKIPAQNDTASQIFIPDSDESGDVPVVLDLASGEMLKIDPDVQNEYEIYNHFKSIGKGDLAYEHASNKGVLFTFRNCKCYQARIDNKIIISGLKILRQENGMSVYDIPEVPCKLYVITGDYKKFLVDIVSVVNKGINITYTKTEMPIEVESISEIKTDFEPTQTVSIYNLMGPVSNYIDRALDLDNDELLSIPGDQIQEEHGDNVKWLFMNGGDVFAQFYTEDCGLIGTYMILETLPSRAWDELSAEGIIEKLSGKQITTDQQVMPWKQNPQPIYAFANQNGTAGLIQMLSVDNESKKIELRYKKLREKIQNIPISTESVQVPIPIVISTKPDIFSDNVPPDTNIISVTFNQTMMDKSWSWVKFNYPFPEITWQPSYDIKKTTCTLPVELEPGKAYFVRINSDKSTGFMGTNGLKAQPYALVFATQDKNGKPTPIPEDMLTIAKQMNSLAHEIPYTQEFDYDILPAGIMRFKGTLTQKNTSDSTMKNVGFRNSDVVHVTGMYDDNDKPLKFTTTQADGQNMYNVTLNEEVMPGQTFSYTYEGTMVGLINRVAGNRNTYSYQMVHSPASGEATLRIDRFLLPEGAELIWANPAQMNRGIKDGRIELYNEEVISPGGKLVTQFQYKLDQ